jgi:hypothetical protein
MNEDLLIVTSDNQSASSSLAKMPRPRLVTPAHGGGRIYRGGVVGHRGGSGRPADRVRRALLNLAKAGLTRVLKPLIDGQRVRVLDRDGRVVEIDPSPADQLRAVEIALKYGLGTADKVKVDAAFENLARVEHVLYLPPLGVDVPPAPGRADG